MFRENCISFIKLALQKNSLNYKSILENTTAVTSRRYIGLYETDKSKNVKIKIKDKVPENCELIYRSGFDKYIISVRTLTTITTLLTIPTAVYSYYFSTIPLQFPEVFNYEEISGDILELYIFGPSFVIANIILFIMSNRFPFRIYFMKQNQSYIGVFPDIIPFTKKHIYFNAGDIKPAPYNPRSLLPWQNAQHILKKIKKIYLFEDRFKTSADYEEMIK